MAISRKRSLLYLKNQLIMMHVRSSLSHRTIMTKANRDELSDQQIYHAHQVWISKVCLISKDVEFLTFIVGYVISSFIAIVLVRMPMISIELVLASFCCTELLSTSHYFWRISTHKVLLLFSWKSIDFLSSRNMGKILLKWFDRNFLVQSKMQCGTNDVTLIRVIVTRSEVRGRVWYW